MLRVPVFRQACYWSNRRLSPRENGAFDRRRSDIKVYRAFRLNNAGQIVGPPIVLSSDDDGAAIDQAMLLVDVDHGVQLWQLSRLVVRLPMAKPMS